jgi:intracellular sulfur oxidation DsrE/DsrF family protein
MKKYIFVFFTIVLGVLVKPAHGQADTSAFTTATAKLNRYDVLYIINFNDEKRIRGTFRNIEIAMEDPRLKGKLHAELLCCGDGVAVYQKNGVFEPILKDLMGKGVVLVQCSNTLTERQIDKSSLFSFILFVPSGPGEVILRQYDGWAIMHP